jgi:small subunit ribosomal protein S2
MNEPQNVNIACDPSVLSPTETLRIVIAVGDCPPDVRELPVVLRSLDGIVVQDVVAQRQTGEPALFLAAMTIRPDLEVGVYSIDILVTNGELAGLEFIHVVPDDGRSRLPFVAQALALRAEAVTYYEAGEFAHAQLLETKALAHYYRAGQYALVEDLELELREYAPSRADAKVAEAAPISAGEHNTRSDSDVPLSRRRRPRGKYLRTEKRRSISADDFSDDATVIPPIEAAWISDARSKREAPIESSGHASRNQARTGRPETAEREAAAVTNIIALKDLLESGVHFGHQTKRWNPKMKEYIFAERNGIYIIDLGKTVKLFLAAHEFVRKVAAEGGKVLFVSTKRQAQDVIQEEATRCGMFYVNERWQPGLLTNFGNTRSNIERLVQLDSLNTSGASRDESAHARTKRRKLLHNLAGVRNMTSLPDVLFIIDPKKERVAVAEARKARIPIVAVVDTNCDPDDVDFVIPGNDDALRSIRLLTSGIASAVNLGLEIKEWAEEDLQLASQARGDEDREASMRERRVARWRQQWRGHDHASN